MTHDDIIRMARKYGCVIAEDGPGSRAEVSFHADQITAMVRAAQAAEREECAKLCEQMPDLEDGWKTNLPSDCAAAIRARG